MDINGRLLKLSILIENMQYLLLKCQRLKIIIAS